MRVGGEWKWEVNAVTDLPPTTGANDKDGDAHLAKPHFAKSESAIQVKAKPYLAKPGNY